MEEKNKSENMREYLKIKKLQDADKSDEMIEEIYEEVINKEENER